MRGKLLALGLAFSLTDSGLFPRHSKLDLGFELGDIAWSYSGELTKPDYSVSFTLAYRFGS